MDKEKLREISREYAESQGFKLNPDKEVVDRILEGLLNNEKNEGYRYCPCKEHKKENICPCKAHKNEIEEMGHCTCGLFVKA